MRRIPPGLSLGLVSLLAIATIRCGGDSPTGPTRPIRQEGSTAAAPDRDLSALAADAEQAPDINAFALALARLGDVSHATNLGEIGDVWNLSPTKWAITITRFPKTGTTMKVTKKGLSPQPAPKFRFKLEAAISIPEAVILTYFLTAGGAECGIGTTPRPFALAANTPKTIDIPNDYILVGPELCSIEGVRCTPSQCKFPLTTTKMKIVFGNGAQGVGQGSTALKYKWVTTTSGGGGNPNPNPNPNPTPNPGPTPDPGNGGSGGSNACQNPPSSAPCGTPTAVCNDGAAACSQNASGTCSSHGGVSCWVCPGPLCH